MTRPTRILIAMLALAHSMAAAAAGPPTAGSDDVRQQLQQYLQSEDPHSLHGRISQLLEAANLVYVEIDTGKEHVWAAGPADATLKTGDPVTVSQTMPMRDFHSKGLNRDFPLIYFVNRFHAEAPPASLRGDATSPATTVPHSKPVTTEVTTGDYLRDTPLDGLNTGDRQLAAYQGKPLLINVWASWCGPCRAEMGSLQALADMQDGKAYNIIGVSTDDHRDLAAAFIQQAGVSFANYHDGDLELEKMLGARSIPLTVLVSADGKILSKVRGAREWNDNDILVAINRVFGITDN
jgi:thiol-disulfide isomerase/thioredoxin